MPMAVAGPHRPGQHLIQLIGRIQSQTRDGGVGPGEHGPQQRPVMFDEPQNRVPAEKIGGVSHDANQLITTLGQGEGEIKLDRSRLDVEITPIQTGQGRQLIEGVLENEEGLNQGVAGQIPGRLHGVDHRVERDFLVGERLEGGLAQLIQEGRKRWIIRKIGPDDQGVDEKADKRLQLGMVPVGDRHAHCQIILPRVSVQQGLKRRQGNHEERRLLLSRQTAQPRSEFGVQREWDVLPEIGLNGGTGMVGGEIEGGRQSLKLLSPIGQMRIQRALLQPITLPGGKVGILDAQLGNNGRFGGLFRPIECGQFPQHHAQRPAVCDDVMEGECQDMMFIGQAIALDSQQGRSIQPEGLPGQDFGKSPGFLRAARLVKRDAHSQFREDAGDRAFLRQGEDGAQALMAGDNAVERCFQRGQIQQPVQLQGDGDVVEAAVGFELLEKPEALLGE